MRTVRLLPRLRWALSPVRARSDTAAGSAAPFLTLERSIGAREGEDARLWDTGAFAAEVYPDLPLATSWRALGDALRAGKLGNDAGMRVPGLAHQAGDGKMLVRTVGVQCRSKGSLRSHILHQALGDEGQHADGTGVASALLCVSGSHPLRRLPALASFLPSSQDTLAIASALRRDGDLPSSLQLWAVTNPLIEADATRLERKVEAGAEVVLTQPPLDWPSFERWLEDADRRGLLGATRLVVGVPMLSSGGNLAFWAQLCDAAGCDWTAGAVARWRQAEADMGGDEFKAWRMQQHEATLQRALALPGVAGLHVMPLTQRARLDTLELIRAGKLAAAAGAPAS